MAESKIDQYEYVEAETTPAKKTIGTTTNAAGGGGAIGGAFATIFVWLVSGVWGVSVPEPVVGSITVVFALIGVYIGGYLSPSKRAEVQAYLKDVAIPSADDIASATSRVVLSAQHNVPVVNPKALVINVDDLTSSESPSGTEIGSSSVVAGTTDSMSSERDSETSSEEPRASWEQ